MTERDTPMPGLRHVVVMGVSGCGKSTLGRALAGALGWPFIEGDSLHPPGNLARMAAGVQLTDADRAPWLAALAARMAAAEAAGRGSVSACSALKRSYRDSLRRAVPRLAFLHLHGPAAILSARMDRPGHFFPASLLQSQLETLEPLAPDEDGLVLALTLPLPAQVAAARAFLRGG